MAPQLVIGIDLGGTKIEGVLLDVSSRAPEEAVRIRLRIPTPQADGYEAILDAAVSLVAEIEREGDIPAGGARVGVGMPGNVTRAGLVKNSNTVCLNGRPFRQDFVARLGREAVFDNDANCFALAEAELGAGAPYRDGVVFGVIMGTGVGGGVVVRGRVWPGAQGIAGEWGHHAVFHGAGPVCYCGRRGCLERFASGPAVERGYEERTGRSLGLREIVQRRSDDAAAAACIDSLVEAFGRGLANVIDILDPTAIVLGGGVSNVDLLYTEGVSRVAHYVFNDELLTPILRHALGDSAGVIGAALLCAGQAS
jgi:fructokinase